MRASDASVTEILRDWGNGNQEAWNQLFKLAYRELREEAKQCCLGERRDHTIQPTALIHEAYLRMRGLQVRAFANRYHFLAAAGVAMRHALVDYARSREARKRGKDWQRVDLDRVHLEYTRNGIDILALDEALARLATRSARQARIVELLFFAGLRQSETAEIVGVSPSVVRNEWKIARAWLRRELHGTGAP